MATAMWNGIIIAESDDTVVVEGNHYFPRESVTAELLPSDTTTHCGWKGSANYFSLSVDGKTNPDAVWYYATPFEAAKEIEGRVAFWKGVVVTE
jgi:uncharacterized protein (DUF427 family)